MGARTCRWPKIRNLVQLHQCSSRVLSKPTVEPLTPISSHFCSSRTRGGCCRQGAGADVVRRGHIVVSDETVSPAESYGDIGDGETGRERPALNRIRPRRCEQSEDDMQIDLSEEQEFFRASTRRFIEVETPLGVVRDLYDTRDGFDLGWWRKAAELGWTSLFVPEQLGGGVLSGRPTCDAVMVAEEMGRLVSPGPFLPVNVVAAAIARAGSEQQRAAVLPGLLSGVTVATWAICEPQGRWELQDIETTATRQGRNIVLDGTKAYVEALGCANHVLVTARTDDGFTQVLVPVETPGVTTTLGRSIDMTRRFGSIRFDEVVLPQSAVVGEFAGASEQVGCQMELAIALQCAELVGVADRTLEFTLQYGRERSAFGRSIMSYQALKHRIADMAVLLEGSKAITDALAAAIDERAATASELASIAKAYVGTHALDIVDDCVQITGGIGVTWEHNIHLYSRRAAVNRAVFGTPEDHKQKLLVEVAALDEVSA